MFGSVKPYKPELKVAEYEAYKAVYCSLCRQIGRRYGWFYRFVLNYDAAFLLMLSLSLKDEAGTFEKKRCVCNPLKSCGYCSNHLDSADRVSAITVLLLYEKVLDNIIDEKGWKQLLFRFLRILLYRGHQKASATEPKAAVISKKLTEQQQRVEHEVASAEQAAEPTAQALGDICTLFSETDVDREHLFRLGYCLGKWVYLADALKDRESDASHQHFNPLLSVEESEAVALLNVCSNEAGCAFEKLPTLYYNGIIKNILYLGLPHEIHRILNPKEGKHERSI